MENQYHESIYIKFGIPALVFDNRVTLLDASVQLYTDVPWTNGWSFQVSLPTSDWSESTITWATQPAHGSTYSLSHENGNGYKTVASGQVMLDLINYQRANGVNFGLQIATPGDQMFAHRYYNSREASSNGPRCLFNVKY